MEKQTQQYLDEITVLKAENNQLKQKIHMLETKVCSAEKRCACYRNNQKLCEETDESR
tara:strand:- start:178 stop:351 length:174 start_codon:yes stop_codon:yes gene_type:complete